MTVVPLRSDRAYAGIGKQTTQGTATAPVYFPRWTDGTSIEIDLKAEDIWEGDTSRRLSTIIKNEQQVKIKHTCFPRPNEVALLESAAMGTGSDTFTAPTITTTTSGSSNTSGATTLTVAAATGLTGSGTAYVVVEPGTTNEEIVALTTPGTGSGPYVYTIASSGTLKHTHAASATVKGQGQHVLTDQVDGDYYTWEFSIGDTAGTILRVRDCKLETCKRSAKSGTLLTYETEWIGIATAVQSAAATVTLDAHQPFLFTQGVWTLDGSTTGDALAVDSFDVSNKNNLDWIQTEQLTGAAIIFGMLALDLTINLIFQNANRIAQTYFGGTSGTADAQTMGTGSLVLVFTQADNFNTLTYSVPSLVYIKTTVPQPKHDGKAWRLPVQATSTSDLGVNTYLLQTTVLNTAYAAY